MDLGASVLGLWVNKAQVSSGRQGKMLESSAWFPRPIYTSKKSLVKLEGQTDVSFVSSIVMFMFFFSSFVSCSLSKM